MELQNRFFEALAQRLRKEPKLSDIVWTMCSASGLYRHVFLEYCFEKPISVFGDIQREFQRNSSKPDFYFLDINGNEYIIENKIYDLQQHFEQYVADFPKAERAFIANYNYIEGEHKGWFIKNWKDFIKHLENNIADNKTKTEEVDLICSFILYLKSVTNYEEAKTMDFSNVSSLRDFYTIISELIEQNGFKENNKLTTAINRDYYGKYFYYTNKEGKDVYIWIGLYIPEHSAMYIYFNEFEQESWLPESERNKIKGIEGKTGSYYDEAFVEENVFYIRLKDEYFNKLCGEEKDVNIQKNIIKKFLMEILDILK
jgi:hypothetical protein